MSNMKVYDSSDFEILDNLIGTGSYSNVFLVKCSRDNQDYAVKVLIGTDSPELKDRFLHEVYIVSHLSHPALVKFYGMTLHYPYYLVSEYMPNKSVQSYIHEINMGQIPEEKRWNMTTKFIIILGVCFGMGYLHSRNIVHRNLKPSNILLDSHYYPKLCDFGQAKELSSSNHCHSMVGTIAFCAPEVMLADGDIGYDGRKADSFSFGMTLYSILYESHPYQEMNNQYQLMKKIVQGERPELNVDDRELKSLNQLIMRCWGMEPMQRPNFEEITNIILAEKDKYVKLNQIDEKKVNEYIMYCNESLQ